MLHSFAVKPFCYILLFHTSWTVTFVIVFMHPCIFCFSQVHFCVASFSQLLALCILLITGSERVHFLCYKLRSVQPVYYKIIYVELELLQNLTKLPYSMWIWRHHYSYYKQLNCFRGCGNYRIFLNLIRTSFCQFLKRKNKLVHGSNPHLSFNCPLRAGASEVVRWVLAACKAIPESIIVRSYKKCCINNTLDGSEDDIVWEDGTRVKIKMIVTG